MDEKAGNQKSTAKDTSGQSHQDDHDVELLRAHLTTTLSDSSDTKKIKSFVTSPDFVKVLQACGSPTDASASVRAVSFMILTKLFNPGSGANDKDASSSSSSSSYPITFIIEQCAQCFSHCLGTGKNVDKLLAYRTLHAIFQTSVTVGAAILCQEGIVEDMMDVVEFEIVDVQVAILEVLAIASADKSCRKLIIKHASTWLAKVAASRDDGKTDPMLKAAAGTTLTKLSAQNASQQQQQQKDQGDDESDIDASLERAMKGVHLDNNDLMENLKKVVTSQTSNSSMMLTAVEGLAYSSVDPGVKESLADDATFLKSLTALSINAASRHSNPLLFGIGTILANITMYRPVLSEQQRQMKKLRDLANAKKSGGAKSTTAAGGDDDDERELDKAVDRRVQKVVDQGCAMALMVLSKNSSVNIRTMAAQTYLNMVTPQSVRGKLLQQGIVKGLVPLAITVDKENNFQEPYKTTATQALAKLAITTDPRLAFTAAQMLDLVRPLLTLCKDDNQLRQFEGLMALTNMASMDDQVRYMIDGADGMAVFENLQLSSNDMVQRAATEMVCNMTFFEPVFERYSNPSSPGAQNRIRLLMILSDHEDVATRRAASGALAILANSADACTMMTKVDKGYERIVRLIDENEQVEVQHRGIEIIRCLVNHFGKQGVDDLVKEQGDRKLVEIVKKCQVNAIRGAAMEVLKLFVGHGVELKA
ncbi:armadillo-type protein [Absidia repens]|uniref:Armadillo-type protein n=1 Tax=Absidia repens TaxID=90262 RepID=A0A1X2IRW5_9FUNG|nr:armadillo-type protein [Absidia repens]